MDGRIDLHIHSNKSCDGDFSPYHIVQMAKAKGFRAISISDHDTVAAYPEALEFGEKAGVEVIPSVEFTTLFDGREFHVLLPFVNWKKKVISRLTRKVSESRLAEAKERVSKLQQLGFDISWKEVHEKSPSSPPLGVKIAQVLLDKAERFGKEKEPPWSKYFTEKNWPFAPYHFYRDYFQEGRPAFVLKRHISIYEVLDSLLETEGVAVLSHPGAYFQQTSKEDLATLKERGLQGLEVYTFYHDAEQVKSYMAIAKELDLVPTAGSDFHGRIKPHVAFGSLQDGEYWMVEELRKRRG
jgi:predicted metal-dependent phosphoesterase TrpH